MIISCCMSPRRRVRRGLTNRIGLFLHTPFPAPGVFMTIPAHADLFRAMCRYDLLGFQTEIDRTAFIDYAVRHAGGSVQRDVSVDLRPRGAHRRLSHWRACGRSAGVGRIAAQPAAGDADQGGSAGSVDFECGPAGLLEGPAATVRGVRAVSGGVSGASRCGDVHADRAAIAVRYRDVSGDPPSVGRRGRTDQRPVRRGGLGAVAVFEQKFRAERSDAAIRGGTGVSGDAVCGTE